jgi:hypothetical protein
MPSHLSYYLQPLDVSCFAPLKRVYGNKVSNEIQVGINYIDKEDFAILYQRVRSTIFTVETITNGFKATSLVPFNPNEVLDRLTITLVERVKIPPLPNTTPWIPETLYNLGKLISQSITIERLIRSTSYSLSSQATQAIQQLVKGCNLAMYSVVILTNENIQLQIANKKVKKKRGWKRIYVSKGGIANRSDILEEYIEVIIAVEEVIPVISQVEL